MVNLPSCAQSVIAIWCVYERGGNPSLSSLLLSPPLSFEFSFGSHIVKKHLEW